MLILVADENFNNVILRGLLRIQPDLDIVRVQDVGLKGSPDPVILEWAAQEQRVLITHDLNTIPRYAFERVKEKKPMPGVIAVNNEVPVRVAIDDILLLTTTSEKTDLESQVIYLPLK
jgi:predicted nuclease of predicted toxin-antitoxin system